jgi:hypothetical protein
MRDKPAAERDEVYENALLFNRDALLYVELCHAMAAGDYSRVDDNLSAWIFMWKAVNKHNYCAQFIRLKALLAKVWPREVA